MKVIVFYDPDEQQILNLRPAVDTDTEDSYQIIAEIDDDYANHLMKVFADFEQAQTDAGKIFGDGRERLLSEQRARVLEQRRKIAIPAD